MTKLQLKTLREVLSESPLEVGFVSGCWNAAMVLALAASPQTFSAAQRAVVGAATISLKRSYFMLACRVKQNLLSQLEGNLLLV